MFDTMYIKYITYTRGILLRIQVSSVTQSCQILCDLTDCSTLGFPVLYHLLELDQTHVHWVGDAIQPSCPLSFPSPPAFNLSQHQGLFQWVRFLHQVVKVLELQHWKALAFPMNIQGWFPLDWLVWSPCCPRDSQESSPAPQCESISPSVLSHFV